MSACTTVCDETYGSARLRYFAKSSAKRTSSLLAFGVDGLGCLRTELSMNSLAS
eukprot:m.83971 g.83971  ORF g.83971 m.83971 type:complete len:54 (+) comp12947_c0_seq1:171-332(+)